jgi:hypothetical protein
MPEDRLGQGRLGQEDPEQRCQDAMHEFKSMLPAGTTNRIDDTIAATRDAACINAGEHRALARDVLKIGGLVFTAIEFTFTNRK